MNEQRPGLSRNCPKHKHVQAPQSVRNQPLTLLTAPASPKRAQIPFQARLKGHNADGNNRKHCRAVALQSPLSLLSRANSFPLSLTGLRKWVQILPLPPPRRWGRSPLTLNLAGPGSALTTRTWWREAGPVPGWAQQRQLCSHLCTSGAWASLRHLTSPSRPCWRGPFRVLRCTAPAGPSLSPCQLRCQACE